MKDQHNERSENQPQMLYVTLILDESGSMQDCKGAAIAGFNQYVASLRHEPAETRFTLTLFNSGKMEVRYCNVRVSTFQPYRIWMSKPIGQTIPLRYTMRLAAR
jgi:hypothetical protein